MHKRVIRLAALIGRVGSGRVETTRLLLPVVASVVHAQTRKVLAQLLQLRFGRAHGELAGFVQAADAAVVGSGAGAGNRVALGKGFDLLAQGLELGEEGCFEGFDEGGEGADALV